MEGGLHFAISFFFVLTILPFSHGLAQVSSLIVNCACYTP